MHSDCVFLYSVEETVQSIAEYEAVIPIGKYQLKYTKNTPVTIFRCEGRELLIYGYAVDVMDGTYESIAEKLLKNSKTIEDVITCEARLGGKYLLLYSDATGTYAVPDATASIPFCYTAENAPFLCACDSAYIAKKIGAEPDAKRLKIRNMGDPSQAMPYNITVYKEIEQLLPNHYYSFSERKAVRFVNFTEPKTPRTPEAAAMQTAPLIENLLRFYRQHFKLYCPITSGRDSRVVLSFMRSVDKNVETYTIKHDHFSDEEPDLAIPKQISNAFSIQHNVLYDTEPPAQMYREFEGWFEMGYSRRTLMLAYTVKSAYGDGAIINGDIMGQIGKCSLHRDIPEKFATAKYFRCKLHNYSKASVAYLEEWIAEIKASKENVNLFDLFSLENRMGRWAAQANLIYSMLGQPNLNIFNSRSIIYPWTLVPRKDRKLSKIHTALIQMKDPSLLNVPFGTDKNIFETIAKWNGISYYFASFAKYCIEKCRYLYAHR